MFADFFEVGEEAGEFIVKEAAAGRDGLDIFRLAAVSVAGVALALQAAFGFGQSGANFGERAGNVAGDRVERFMSAAEAQLELDGASDQSTARGPRQRLDGEGGVVGLTITPAVLKALAGGSEKVLKRN